MVLLLVNRWQSSHDYLPLFRIDRPGHAGRVGGGRGGFARGIAGRAYWRHGGSEDGARGKQRTSILPGNRPRLFSRSAAQPDLGSVAIDSGVAIHHFLAATSVIASSPQ